MATVKSTQITNLDASPVVREPAHRDGAMLRQNHSAAVISATIPSGDIVHMVRVPSNARVHDVLTSAADATTALAADVGLYSKNADGTYTVVDADFFASAFDYAGGPFNNFSVVRESGVYTIANTEKMLWEALGLTVDPKIDYFVSLTITTTGNGGPTSINLTVEWTK
jgi:hypothetical protein